MKIKIFFTGHSSLKNRGCEAIIRSIIHLFQNQLKNALYLIPSEDPEKDNLLWGKDKRVKFFYSKVPLSIRIWSRLTRINLLKKFFILFSPPLPKAYISAMIDSDIIFSIGGDNYTNDAQFPLWVYKADKTAIKLGKKTILMFATVSNFKDIVYKKILKNHFKRFKKIIAREKGSYNRLKNDYKINNVLLSADPSFFLKKKKPIYYKNFFNNKKKNNPVNIGINISALLNKLGDNQNLENAVSELIKKKPRYNFVLIPHVFLENDNDLTYLKNFYMKIKSYHPNIFLIDQELSAQEIKFIIGDLTILIAARTHVALAGFSQEIPTISIAYSEKAYDIGRLMYGSDRFTLDYKKVKTNTLVRLTDNILLNDKLIRLRFKIKNKEIKNKLRLDIKNLTQEIKEK
jgi:colanic acid/amylovoran biosynthesis protein